MTTIRIAERRQFTIVCNETADDNRLSLRARGLMLWLLSKPDGWKINARLIATVVPEGRDAVLATLKELETFGYLRHEKVQMPGGQWVTQTFLYESPGTGNQDPVNQEPVNQEPVFQDVRDLVMKESIENKTHGCDEGFIEFWAGYPRKTGKPSALRAWKKVTADERLLVMVALSVRVKFWKDSKTEVQFIPHPSTWLNDRRWEDEVPNSVPEVVNGGRRWDERRKIWLEPGVG